MQAVLLAAGNSSRMFPFDSATSSHKSMIKILGKPLLEHVILGLKSKNITDLIIVVNKNNNIKEYFGDGSKFDVNIKYVVQVNAQGAGNALLLCKDLIRDDFILLNSYRVDCANYVDTLIEKKKDNDAVLLLNERENTWLYGVVKIEDEKVVGVVEKPEKGMEPSKKCIVGIYLFSKNFLETLGNTSSEHYQLEKALDSFSKSHKISFVESDEENIVLKYPWDLLNVKNYLLKSITSLQGENIKLGKNVIIEGQVFIGDNVTIMDGATIKGPCFIGNNSYIGSNSLLRDGVDVEENCVVGSFMEVKNSLIMNGSKTHSGFLGDSIIGENVKLAAGFNTTNVRLDRENVTSIVGDQKIDSGLRNLGVIIGNSTQLGGNVTIMPGIIIGSNSIIGPSTTVVNNVDGNVKYYTEFKEIIVKKNE